MKNYSMMLLSILVIGTVSFAHAEDLEIEVDTEIDNLYIAEGGSTQAIGNKKSGVISGQPAVTTQTIVAPQPQVVQQTVMQSPVQKQPTTLIEASPLSDSRADQIRRTRQDEEMRTESKIVEKLEQSRMEDEKRRASVLFGDKFDHMNQSAAPTAIAPVVVQQAQPAPAPQVLQPVYIEPKEELSREAVREEVRAALRDDETAVVAPMETKYFAGMAGIGEYPDVNNVKGNYALGAAFGTRYDYFLVEGAFLMSNYSVDMLSYTNTTAYRMDNYEVNQYQGIISAKYQLLGGVIRPVLGGLIAYSYRNFTLTNAFAGNTDTGNSHAIDLGITTGVDIELTPKFSLGLDLKYMFNMSSRVNSNYQNSTYMRIGTPIEKLQYYIAGIAARVNF